MGGPYPPSGQGKTGGTRVYPGHCGSGWILCISCSPTKHPYPQGRPRRTKGTRVYPPLAECLYLVHTSFSNGASLSLKLSWQNRGTQLYPPLCGSAGSCAYVALPQAIADPRWSRQDRRESGVSTAVPEGPDTVQTRFSHGASLSPRRPKQDRRDSSVSAAVWQCLDPMHARFSHRASLSQGGLGRTGGIWVHGPLCGRGRKLLHAWFSHTVSLSPPAAQAGPEGRGCMRRCMGGARSCAYLVPRGGGVLRNPISCLKTPQGQI